MSFGTTKYPDQLHDTFTEGIKQHGHIVVGVIGELDVNGKLTPSFAYTIGLTTTFGYELFVCGLNPRVATVIINDIVSKGTVELGVPQTQFTNLPILFKQCDLSLGRLHDQYVCQADNFYGKEVNVVQIILSDREGRTPLDDTYDHEHMDKFQMLFVDFTK